MFVLIVYIRIDIGCTFQCLPCIGIQSQNEIETNKTDNQLQESQIKRLWKTTRKVWFIKALIRGNQI